MPAESEGIGFPGLEMDSGFNRFVDIFVHGEKFKTQNAKVKMTLLCYFDYPPKRCLHTENIPKDASVVKESGKI